MTPGEINKYLTERVAGHLGIGAIDGRIYAVASSDDSVVSAAKLNARMVMFADRPWPMRMPAIQKHRDLIKQLHGGPELPPLAPVVSIRGYIPDYLDNELAIKAAERRVTKTFLMMEALQKAGYRVEEHDMVQDRRKAKRP